MQKIKRYLKKDKNYIDIIWFILFSSAAIFVPLCLWWADLMWMNTTTIISMVSSSIGFLGGLLLLQRNKFHVMIGIPGNALLGVVLWMNGVYAVAIINWTIAPLVHLWGAWKWQQASKKGIYIESRELGFKKGFSLAVMSTIIFGAIGSILVYTPGGDPTSYVSWMDAATGVMFLAAMILSALMYKEQYWAWLTINIFCVAYFSLIIPGIGFGNEIQYWAIPTMVLFGGYFFSSIWGHYKWRV